METCDGAQFASPEALAIAPDCEPQGCGVNGAWLGQQLKFRELHLQPGQENQQRLAITSFTGPDGERLRLGFAPDKLDEVVGYPARGEPVRGAQLRGATLELSSKGKPTYRLTFDEIAPQPSWSCAPTGDDRCEPRTTIPLYRFTVTGRTEHGGRPCKVELCDPNLSRHAGALQGTAVIFQGDVYDDNGFRIRSKDFPDPDHLRPGEQDVFNIACVGTAISKLHFLGHTSASDPSTTYAQRQTLFRLLTGDYCGTGHPFTTEGHPIKLAFESPLRITSAYDMKEALSIDARWSKDGATCLGTPRLSDQEPKTLQRIQRHCGREAAAHGRTYNPGVNTSCGPMTLAPYLSADGLLQGSYAISGNAFK